MTPQEQQFHDNLQATVFKGNAKDRAFNTDKLTKKLDELKLPEVIKVSLEGAEIVTIKGEKGDTGDQGIQGEKGDKGDTGKAGKDGKDGIDGRNGIDGVDGKDGSDGRNGTDGIDGLNGRNGKDGSPDTGVQIKDKLSQLKGSDRLDVKSLSGVDDFGNALLNEAKGFVPRSLSALYDINLSVPPGDGQGLIYNAATNKWIPGNVNSGEAAAIEFLIDGGGSAITSAVKGDLVVPYNCRVIGWALYADQTGSIVVDVLKDIPANFPPTTSITGSDIPTLTSQTNALSVALTGWTTTLNMNDVLRFKVNSASTITRVTLSLKIVKL